MKIPHLFFHVLYCTIIGGLLFYNRHYDQQQRHLQIESAQLLQQCLDVAENSTQLYETWIRLGIESYPNELNLRWLKRLDVMRSSLTTLHAAAKKASLDSLDPAIRNVQDSLNAQFPDDTEVQMSLNRLLSLHNTFLKAEPELLQQVVAIQEVLIKALILQEAAKRGVGCEDCVWPDYDIIRIVGTDTVPKGMPYKVIFRLVPVQSRQTFKVQCKINGVEYPVDRNFQVVYSEPAARPGKHRIGVQMLRTNPLTGVVDMYQREFEYFSE